jgi:hypothetical protein
MEKGKCKLCLEEKMLCASHLVPKALYRMARGPGRRGNQDPHMVTVKGRTPTSYQVKDYVFCRECEQRLSINGEDYVMPLVTRRDGRFPFLEMLNGTPTRLIKEKWRAYSPAETPDIDRAKIAYFALSIFWRASIHTWKAYGQDKVELDLGKTYNEEIRKYLLGQAPIPENARLLVAVCSDKESQISFFMPGENKKVKDHSFGVMLRGLFLLFRVTKTPPPWLARLSMINNPRELISVWDCYQQGVWSLGDGK